MAEACYQCDGDGFGPNCVGNCPRCGGGGKERPVQHHPHCHVGRDAECDCHIVGKQATDGDNLRWLDEIEAQADSTVPYYVPRLIAEIRHLERVLALMRKVPNAR
jgi:hypothetical protein